MPSLTLTDLKLYGSASMPDDNTPTAIGGAIATSKKIDWQGDVAGLIQIVSSSAGDTTQTVQAFYRDPSGTLLNETRTLNGTTPVGYSANVDRLMKALKSATTGGAVAIESQTAVRTGTCQAGSTVNTLVLDAGASAVNGFYIGTVVRLTGGTGSGQINEIVGYDGTTKTATMQDYWHGSIPDATTTFRISNGFFFDRLPNEITEVRRPFYNAAANPPGGGAITFFDKCFFVNSSNSGALLTAQVVEFANPSGKIDFGLEAIVNGTNSNGAGNNRTVAPSGVSFATSTQTVPGTNLNAGSSIGVWLRLSLLDGDTAARSSVTMQLTGSAS